MPKIRATKKRQPPPVVLSPEELTFKQMEEELEKLKTELSAVKLENEKLREQQKEDKKDIEEWKERAWKNCSTSLDCFKQINKLRIQVDVNLNHYKKQVKLTEKAYKKVDQFRKPAEEIWKMVAEAEAMQDHYRQRYLNLVDEKMRTAVAKNGEPFPWQVCEICLIPYNGKEEGRSPRMLGCGHTLCLDCCVKMIEPEIARPPGKKNDVQPKRQKVKCSYCRSTSTYGGSEEQIGTKNCIVLDMCS